MKDILLSQRFFPEIGGSISWLHQVYKRFPSKVTLITHSYPSDSFNDTELAEDFEIIREDIQLENWGLDSIGQLKKYYKMHALVKEQLSEHRKVRVHCTHAIPEALSLFFLKIFNKKNLQIVSYAHGEEILACESSRQLKLLLYFAYWISDLVIANSNNTKNLVSKYCKNSKIKVIHPGTNIVSDSEISKYKDNFFKKKPELREKKIVLSLGRIEPKKNHINCLKALLELREDETNFYYIIAGSGSNLPRIKEFIDQNNMGDYVETCDEISEETKLELLSASDFFLMPSIVDGNDLEGFGIVFIEAASFGKTSISGNTGGQIEAVLDQETGLNVNGERVEEIKNALRDLLNNEELKTKFETKAKKRSKDFSWEKVLEETVSEINEVIV